jgi:ABC-type antimicrobial peptide transport system permease subunit
MMKQYPPKRALRFLRWFCREDYLEEIEGDLTELFENETADKRSGAGRRFFWRVVRYFRPAFIKSFQTFQPLNPITMFRHNLRITLRHIFRYKRTALINLIGLSLGLSAALLIGLWTYDELNMDGFHTNGGQLYQILKNSPQVDQTIVTMPYTPAMLASSLREEFPEIEFVTSVVERDQAVITRGENKIKSKHIFADSSFFHVFSFEPLAGRCNLGKDDKYNVVISDELATKLFGSAEASLGQTVDWAWWDNFSGSYQVTGVFKRIPVQSSLQFDAVFAHAQWMEVNKNNENWISNNAHTYVVLRNDADPAAFAQKVSDLGRSKVEATYGKDALQYEGTVIVQRFADRYLHGTFENGVPTGGRIQYVRLFTIIGSFVLLIACINFMNLSTARAGRRLKEVGIKKAIGARRSGIMTQHFVESMTMAFVALFVAVGIAYVALPAFESVTGKSFGSIWDRQLLMAAVAICLITGVVAGSYPALYLSGLRPVNVLKGVLITSIGEEWMRRGLVVFQFVISAMLILAVIVVYKQIDFIQQKNLGFNKENIVTFSNEGTLRKNPTLFLEQVRNIPGVFQASTMSGDLIGNHGGGGGISWDGKDPNEGIEFNGLYADYGLIELLNIDMVEGLAFKPAPGNVRNQVIFNQTAINMMKLKDPVGKTAKLWGADYEIVGVSRDFHYESLYRPVGPLFIRLNEFNQHTLIRIVPGKEQETIADVKALYESFTEGLVFDYRFLDQDFAQLYAAENRVSELSRYFAGLAILISCLGLFGLVSFTTERRAKEMSIRKVLGAGEAAIVYLLSNYFSRMVLISVAIALPFGYWLMQSWLNQFAFKVTLHWQYFAFTGLATLLVALLTVGTQAWRAALVNPVKNLRNE